MLELSNTVDTVAQEEKGRDIILYDEHDEPYIDPETKKPVPCRIVGSYSKTFKKNAAKVQARRAKQHGKPTEEEKDQDQRDTWAGGVVSWGFTLNGKQANPADVFALKPHIYDQIVKAVGNHAAFFEKSSTG